MANPYLSPDESVVLATDKVLFRSVTLPAVVLTNKRVLLLQTDGEALSADEILLSKLQSAEIDKSPAADPVLTLTYITGTGEFKKETLTFLEKNRKLRTEECGEWVKKLNEEIGPSIGEGTLLRIPPSAKKPTVQPAGEPVPQAGAATPAATGDRPEPPGRRTISPVASSDGGILAKHDRPAGFAFPSIPKIPESELPDSPAPPPRRKIVMTAALLLVILVVIGGAFLFTQFFPPKPTESGMPAAAAPVITTVVTPVPTPLPTTTPSSAPMANETQVVPVVIPGTPSQTPLPTATTMPAAALVLIPPTGVWVRVSYDGNFTGSLGEGAGFRPVTGTGEHFYQLATKSGTVRAIIGKKDNSGKVLSVEIYQDGVLVGRDTTAIPQGETNIQINLKAATPTVAVLPNATGVNVTGAL